MIALTPGRDRRDRRRPAGRTLDPDTTVTGQGGVRQPQGGAGRPVPGHRRRAGGRPRLRRGGGGGRRGGGAGHPAGRRCRRSWWPTRSRRSPRWPGAVARRLTASDHRHHRLVGQDLDQGPAGPGAGRRRADGGRRRSSFNNELGLSVHGAAGRRGHRVPGAGDLGPRHRPHPAPDRHRAARGSAAVLNVGTAHLGEFGSVAAIAQAKGELVEALPADGGGGAQRRRPAGARRWRRAPGARVVTFGEQPRRRRARRAA